MLGCTTSSYAIWTNVNRTLLGRLLACTLEGCLAALARGLSRLFFSLQAPAWSSAICKSVHCAVPAVSEYTCCTSQQTHLRCLTWCLTPVTLQSDNVSDNTIKQHPQVAEHTSSSCMARSAAATASASAAAPPPCDLPPPPPFPPSTAATFCTSASRTADHLWA